MADENRAPTDVDILSAHMDLVFERLKAWLLIAIVLLAVIAIEGFLAVRLLGKLTDPLG